MQTLLVNPNQFRDLIFGKLRLLETETMVEATV